MGTSHIEVTRQDYGGRYQEVDRHSLTVNSQYNSIGKSDALKISGQAVTNFAKDQISRPGLDRDGTKGGGLYFGLLQDLAKAISNFLLEGQAIDVIEAMKKEESEARAKIIVIAGKD